MAMATSPRIGEIVDGHRIDSVIGRGGMGVVYLGEHLRLGRKVAIKVLSPDLANDAMLRERFLRESRAAAALDHPNIVSVYDAGEAGDIAYISMQYIEGGDLAAELRRIGVLDSRDTVAIVWQVASALDAAHAQGLVHRDVKPANILLQRRSGPDSPYRAYLSDFGITKRVGGDGPTTGQFLGTIDYMAPEQITGGTIDGRTDQYSLACVLFQCLAGRVPFARDDHVGVMYAHLQDRPPSLAEINPDLPPAIDDVLRTALSKPRERRFATCVEFAEAAGRALGVDFPAGPSTGIGAAPRVSGGRTPGSPTHRRARPSGGSRRKMWAIVASVAAVVAVVAGVLVWNAGPGSEPQGGPTTGVSPSAATSPPVSPTPSQTPTRPETPFPAGFTWERVADPGRLLDGAGDQTINRLFAAAGRIVAVGYEGVSKDTDAAVWLSSDGTAWDKATIGAGAGPGNQNMAAVVYDGHQFIAVGTVAGPGGDEDGGVWTSVTGGSWSSVEGLGALVASGDQEIRRVIRVDGGIIAVGWDSSPGRGRDAAVWESPDGTIWTRRQLSSGSGPGQQEMWNLVRFRGGLVAVGSDTRAGHTDAAVWRFDGATWSREDELGLHAPGNQTMKAVVAAGPGLVAVGSSGNEENADAAVWTSVDGTTWTRLDPELLRRPGYQEMNNAIAVDGGVVVVGTSGPAETLDAAVWTSPNGLDWTTSANPGLSAPGSERLKSVISVNGVLVAAGHATFEGDGNAAVWIGTPIPAPEASPTGSPTS